MNTNTASLAVMFQASPFRGVQAPDHVALGHSTQLELPGETKAFPFMKAYPKHRPTGLQPMLPVFPLGVAPTYNLQQGSEQRLKGKDLPHIFIPSRMVAADLVEAYEKINESHRVIQKSNDAYQGSPWAYGPREGLPFGSTQTGDFVRQMSADVKSAHVARKVDALVKLGFEPQRIHRVIEEQLDESLRQRLYMAH